MKIKNIHHKNKCRKPKPHYSTFFKKKEWIDKIANYYKKDIERFGYKFEYK